MSLCAVGLLWLGGYLVASIPFGLLVARARGIDIRQVGSGNIGSTNVGRALGRGTGLLVLALDALKGLAPMSIAGRAGALFALPDWGTATINWIRLGMGLACMLGATAPIYLRFRGGKGVASSLGIVLAVPQTRWPALAALALWALVRFATGYVSLASIVAAVALPCGVAASTWRGAALATDYPLMIMTGGMALVVLFRHRSNLIRLLAGTEHRVAPGEAAPR
ncbi:MAG: glycerol-3-phosphate 1-O-acyltransferase PlsY [Phycisphaerae bacterium]